MLAVACWDGNIALFKRIVIASGADTTLTVDNSSNTVRKGREGVVVWECVAGGTGIAGEGGGGVNLGVVDKKRAGSKGPVLVCWPPNCEFLLATHDDPLPSTLPPCHKGQSEGG